MPMVEHLFDLFRDPEAPQAEDPQANREALVDLLVWTMFVDHHLALAEKEALERFTADLPWTAVESLETYLRESTARAREVLGAGDEASQEYLRDIRDRLPDEKDRRRVLTACQDLVNADGRLRPQEAEHLRAVVRAFDL